MSDAIDIRPAVRSDLLYIDSLQRKNAEELSFYPSIVFEREIDNGRVLLALVNGEHAGYLYHGALRQSVNIHQACIQYDLRGMTYGSILVGSLLSTAALAAAYSVTCHCGSDIAANFFWRALGFRCESTTKGGVRRMRDINHWKYDIQEPLFTTEAVPSERKADASLWRRTHSDSVSQFIRGPSLRAYREMLKRREK